MAYVYRVYDQSTGNMVGEFPAEESSAAEEFAEKYLEEHHVPVDIFYVDNGE